MSDNLDDTRVFSDEEAETLSGEDVKDDEISSAAEQPEEKESDAPEESGQLPDEEDGREEPSYGGDLPEEDEFDGSLPPEDASQRESYRMPGFLKAFIFVAAVLLVGFVCSLFAWKAATDVFAFSKPDREVQIVIRDGDTMGSVIDSLYDEGLIRYKGLFRFYCNLTHAETKISTGTFTLNNLYDYHALVNGLRSDSGAREVVRVMIPEGLTCRQIFELLANNGVCSVEELENTAAAYPFEYSFLENVPYGSRYRLEGYLYPDTYEFYVDDTPERVLKKFLSNFNGKFSESLREDIALLNERLAASMRENGFTEEEIAAAEMDVNRIVVVASIIQKESSGVSESSSISAVVYNRLTSKIYPLLQMDSILRYYLNKYDEPLTDQDRSVDSSYNTDRHVGLPDGAICNPTVDSIRAALYPRDAGYLFYTINKNGNLHHFSNTYLENMAYIEERDNG